MRQQVSSHRSAVLAARAASMRSAPTTSEALLFEAVRAQKLGVAFRRQVPLCGRYIADLYAPSVRLVIEVDGGYHAQRGRADERRDRALRRAGYHVLRVDAALAERDMHAVLARVREEIQRLALAQCP
jgi:very-short-patch-repair endonuclease